MTLAARRRGAAIRPLGDVIVLMPAPAMSAADLERLVTITAAAIAEASADARDRAGHGVRRRLTTPAGPTSRGLVLVRA